MDYTNPEFWIAIGVGGSLIASLSAGQQWLNKDNGNEPFNTRAVIRDFCLGAFLTATLYMFLPESFHSWISSASALIPSSTTQSGGSLSSSSAATQDIELQVGPARF
jgi:hypothetical protein